jgi:hypothetical protein
VFALCIVLAAAKENEMEIGYPTDVKHVAHIGWDSAASNASPSWVSTKHATPEFFFQCTAELLLSAYLAYPLDEQHHGSPRLIVAGQLRSISRSLLGFSRYAQAFCSSVQNTLLYLV